MKKRMAIIGGGFSGTALVHQLAKHVPSEFHVTLIDPNPTPGPGLAYGAADAWHLLNVTAGGMSLDPDEPDDFLEWSKESRPETRASEYLPRRQYGLYLSTRLNEQIKNQFCQPICASVDDLVRLEKGWKIILNSGVSNYADVIVLACGHPPPFDPLVSLCPSLNDAEYARNPWVNKHPIDREARVGIIGTGLTMVDKVYSLLMNGHRGPIVAVSRRGLLPRPHLDRSLSCEPQTAAAFVEAVKQGEISQRLKAFRKLLQKCEEVDWRAALQALRPHSQALWMDLPPKTRSRFLRHLRPFWDAHRHRLPPALAEQVSQWLNSGHLRLLKGRIREVVRQGGEIALTLENGFQRQLLIVDHILNCTGSDWRSKEANALETRLLAKGYLAQDRHGLGFCANAFGQVLGPNEEGLLPLYLLGPARRADLWEATAVPELRVQAKILAQKLISSIS